MAIEKAMFGAGCFWGVEMAYASMDGVVSTKVGYSGGVVQDPTYRQVCTGQTGHAEVILIEFDSDQISFQALLDKLFEIHDPTTLNRPVHQGHPGQWCQRRRNRSRCCRA